MQCKYEKLIAYYISITPPPNKYNFKEYRRTRDRFYLTESFMEVLIFYLYLEGLGMFLFTVLFTIFNISSLQCLPFHEYWM